MKFDERKVNHKIPSKQFCFAMPIDLYDRLEKVCPDEISLSEAIRQILCFYLGIERPLHELKIKASPEEIAIRRLMPKRVKKDRRSKDLFGDIPILDLSDFDL